MTNNAKITFTSKIADSSISIMAFGNCNFDSDNLTLDFDEFVSKDKSTINNKIVFCGGVLEITRLGNETTHVVLDRTRTRTMTFSSRYGSLFGNVKTSIINVRSSQKNGKIQAFYSIDYGDGVETTDCKISIAFEKID